MNSRLIYCPDGKYDWEMNTFMTPHVMLIHPGVIRIWGGVRDKEGISRIKYIDVDENNPTEVLHVSEKPCLDIGKAGCFDDNGVILGDIILADKNKLYMYYVGFQHVQKVKFFAFSGLAISTDGGKHFERYMQTPVLDRTDKARFGRCIHTVLYDEGIFKCYYAIINNWKVINNIPYPVYNIWYTESEDGIHFSKDDSVLCIDTEDEEYRIGRPKVYRTEEGYEMYYTRDLVTKEYLAGYATSVDGVHWTRQDEKLPLVKSGELWDSEMACYPVKLTTTQNTYLFYNGNGMGRTGVGYMKL
ncbi:MAG: hypothetical protein NC347_02045 [Clostridium sp.]|nr:hypothetical protein [Clostridium sp.]